MRRLNILTWHTHGSYLHYLSHIPHDIHVLAKPGRPPGYAGRPPDVPWRDNVFDMPVELAASRNFDCILFQEDHHYARDQYEFLTPVQRRLPRIYLEHDPPQEHPTNTCHPVTDPSVLVVHVTHFNRLMWNCGEVPTIVIEHGVPQTDQHYDGELERGIVVVNHLLRRGRRLGADVFAQCRESVALDLVGMGAEEAGGLGEIPLLELSRFSSRYRFFFNPIRYTSLGLAVIEAMMVGLPLVAVATTEMATLVENEYSGFVSTDPELLVTYMQVLLRDPALAKKIGQRGRLMAQQRFAMSRFVKDWNAALALACN